MERPEGYYHAPLEPVEEAPIPCQTCGYHHSFESGCLSAEDFEEEE